jgi:uncharacterized protein (TIGR03000 family)
MWQAKLFFAKLVLAAGAAVFATAQPSLAQHGHVGGGRGAFHSGGGVRVQSGTFRGGIVNRGGWYGSGGRVYGGGGWYGGIGLGLYGGPAWYGGWGSGYYGPDYYAGSPYYFSDAPQYFQGAPVTPDTGYRAFYPPTMIADNTALIEVQVPPDAEIWFDGTKTTQRGSVRNFTTPPLTPGQTFTYEIRATLMANGAPVTQTRQVQVQAGKRAAVNFMTGG